MIFDSKRMAKLRRKYSDAPDFRVPSIVLLDRHEELAGERIYLESLMPFIPPNKRNDLLGKLLQEDEGQHRGAWFELMLFGWLREQQIGAITVEPEIEGDNPDFALETEAERVVIEARAHIISETERAKAQQENAVTSLLESIAQPYIVLIEKLELADSVDKSRLQQMVEQWLVEDPSQQFNYQDHLGNCIILSVLRENKSEQVATIGPTRTTSVNAEPVKAVLRQKAGQHRAIRRAGYPYIIAVFLEPWSLSAEEIVTAWLGREQVTIDVNTMQVVDVRVDRSGLHYFARELRHTTVSGTLAFKRNWIPTERRHRLRAWYVENPYAKTPVSAELFCVESSYVVIGRDNQNFQMAWR